MNTLTFFIVFVCLLVLTLLVIQNLVSISNPYSEKVSPYECGFIGYGTAQQPFSIQFFLVGILFMVFDIEVILLYPFAVSLSQNSLYGFWIYIIFIGLLTIGFIYEFAKGALKFTSLQLSVKGSPPAVVFTNSRPRPGEGNYRVYFGYYMLYNFSKFLSSIS